MRKRSSKNKETLITFCENVKVLRKRNGLTKSKMADCLGVSVRSISSLEKGIVPPRLSCEILFRIQVEFGVNPTGLLKKRLF